MVDFKKRALILTLAATVSVTGSFAADNYKNCLMNMEFKPVSNNEISVILNTKTQYQTSISPMRKDANTFIIMLPETDNQAPTPDLSQAGNCIKSVEIRKMPYSNGAKGYTKILIKTEGTINLNATSAVYIPPLQDDKKLLPPQSSTNEDNLRERQETKSTNINSDYSSIEKKTETSPRRMRTGKIETPNSNAQDRVTEVKQEAEQEDSAPEAGNAEENHQVSFDETSGTYNQKYLLGLLVVFIILTSIYLYIKAQDKLTNVLGEKLKIDISDDEPEEKTKKTRREHRISRTINKLDSAYPQTIPLKIGSIEPQTKQVNAENTEEEMNVVDLDALFKEKQEIDKVQTEQALSDALDDFLSSFSFDDNELLDNIANSEDGNQDGYDENIYQKIINNTALTFTKDDILCFKNLLESEISDEVLRNIENYAAPVPAEKKNPSQDKILEKFVTDYTISQNITFNEENIRTLKKLISVELDRDFIYDLRTDAKLTKSMEEDILSSKPLPQKPKENVTLNVKDLLPNLADEVKKQGNRPIQSEVQPQVVYFKEGYDVSKLSPDIELPDLSKEVKRNKGYVSTPSAAIETVDNSYSNSVDKISITGLPDLKDVMANPEKYEDKAPEEYIPDENAMLNSILNVQFKPFDDGTRNFEIINNIDDDEEEITSLPVVDIQKEFSQFSNFEVAENEDDNVAEIAEYDDFEALYNQNYVDLDANKKKSNSDEELEKLIAAENIQTIQPEPIIKKDNTVDSTLNNTRTKEPAKQEQEKFVPKNLNKVNVSINKDRKVKSENLVKVMNKIQSDKNKTISKSAVNKNETKISTKSKTEENAKTPSPVVKCIFEGVNYDILSSAALTSEIGCHLAKSSNGYSVFTYKGDDLSIIKQFASVKSEKIYARLSEKLDNGALRFIIKVGTNKFIVDVANDNARYVMDLC